MSRVRALRLGALIGACALFAAPVCAGEVSGPFASAAVGGLLVGALLTAPARRAAPAPATAPARPMSVAVAGDSGTGKDTLCLGLTSVFGESDTTFLMGDDYHHADRAGSLWRTRTHLHPAANDLAQFNQDALALLSGRGVLRAHYDHARGRYTEPRRIEPSSVVVLSGLHALTSSTVRDVVDLTVFTDMDEALRRRLKIERDVNGRGHTLAAVQESLQRREPDRQDYILPQRQEADVVLRLEPTGALPAESEPLVEPLDLRLVVTLRDLSFGDALCRSLTSLTGQPPRVRHLDEPGAMQLTATPDSLTDRDIAALANQLLPDRAVSGNVPVWSGGSHGLMQLVITTALLEKRAAARELEIL